MPNRWCRHAIQTRYAGPTDSRGARVLVKAQAGRMAVPWDHACDMVENHYRAAEAFRDRQGWVGELQGGALADGSHSFIIIDMERSGDHGDGG